MLISQEKKRILLNLSIILFFAMVLTATGCVSTQGTALQQHQDTLGDVMENEYHIPKRPIDRAYIGCAWSKQFGPIEDSRADEIRVKKERSLNSIQQDFAFHAGIGLGGQTIAGPVGEAGIEGGSAERAKLEGVQIISPISLADIPFEPDVPYVTEALRLENFRLKADKSNRAGINISAGTVLGSGSATAEIGSKSRTGTSGEGLVVAYKLHAIDSKSYETKESGFKPLPLDKATYFPEAKVAIEAVLHVIEPGAKKSLPRNILWACDYAEAKSRDMVAAFVIRIKALDPKRKSLAIGFPGYPKFEDCYSFSGVIFSAIDPLTDKIHREKINIAIIDYELSDTLKPIRWDARISLVTESFNIKMVLPSALSKK